METSNCRPSTPDGCTCPTRGSKNSDNGSNPSDSTEGLSRWERTITRELVETLDGACSSITSQILLAGIEGLDLLGIAWLVCNHAGCVKTASLRAKEVLRSADALALRADGVISCRSTKSEQTLYAAIGRISQSAGLEETEQRAAVLIRGQFQMQPLTLLLKLMTTNTTAIWREPTVLIMILNPNVHTGATQTDLYELYRFTAAETELANLLMSRKSLIDCSRDLGITYSTARTHLDSMFKKTGMRHQAQLVSLLLRSIGLVRPAHQRLA